MLTTYLEINFPEQNEYYAEYKQSNGLIYIPIIFWLRTDESEYTGCVKTSDTEIQNVHDAPYVTPIELEDGAHVLRM